MNASYTVELTDPRNPTPSPSDGEGPTMAADAAARGRAGEMSAGQQERGTRLGLIS